MPMAGMGPLRTDSPKKCRTRTGRRNVLEGDTKKPAVARACMRAVAAETAASGESAAMAMSST
jgi:hypothetical protein